MRVSAIGTKICFVVPRSMPIMLVFTDLDHLVVTGLFSESQEMKKFFELAVLNLERS